MKKRLRQATQSVLAFALSAPAILGATSITALAEESTEEEYEYVSNLESPLELEERVDDSADEADAEMGNQVETISDFIDDSEEVRVIVEVDEQSGLSYATEQGVSYESLDESTRLSLETSAQSTQDSVQSSIQQAGVAFEVQDSYTTILNGFSGNVEFGNIETIAELPGVEAVHISVEYEAPEVEESAPNMTGTIGQVRAVETWKETGINGEGTVIGIIDSGIDPEHQDFILSEDAERALNESDVLDADVPGTYFSEKIPYGYNYIDGNSDVYEEMDPGETNSHGQHVAGTAAANGDIDDGGVKGVAPEAQLLGLKVFPNDPTLPQTTYTDIYLAAMDDAVKLGVDVLNLSLGSPTGSINAEESAMAAALERMQENGVITSISAGNSAHFGNGAFNPYASNPDTATVGSPSLNPGSFSVASSDNSTVSGLVAESEVGDIGYITAAHEPTEVFNEDESVPVTYAGYGSPEELEDANAEGTFVVVSRGGPDDIAPFLTKIEEAYNHGAVGIAIHNNASGYIGNMGNEPAFDLPQIDISQESGQAIAAAIEDGEEVTFTFSGESFSTTDPETPMSSFTSWGLAPNLDFKPEVTAPGGGIHSTYNDGEYGSMSGTSMAAPHVAGGSALILDYVDQTFENIDGFAREELAKKLIMNTAVPLTDQGPATDQTDLTGGLYSPRLQGAGQMDLYSATTTPAYVSSPEDDDKGKVALREFEDSVSFILEVTNFSEEDVTYTIEETVQTDLVLSLGEEGIDQLGAGEHVIESAVLTGYEFTSVDEINVSAGATETIEFTLDVSDAEVEYLDANLDTHTGDPDTLFDNGYYVDGFVEFVDEDGGAPTLSVPFAGFNGDWNEPPIIDGLSTFGLDDDQAAAVEAEYGPSFYGESGFVSEYIVAGDTVIPAYNDLMEIPGREGVYYPYSTQIFNGLIPHLSFLRNAEEVNYTILDENGEQLRTLYTQDYVGADIFDQGRATFYTGVENANWDGTINEELADEGVYYLEVAARANFEGSEFQTTRLPILFDETPPAIEIDLSDDAEEANVTVTDAGSGLVGSVVVVDGEIIEQHLTEDGDNVFEQEYTVELPEDASYIAVEALDFFENENAKTESISVSDDAYEHDRIELHVASPEMLETFSTYDIPVSGHIETNHEVATIEIHGQEVEFNYDPENNIFVWDDVITVEEEGEYYLEHVVTTTEGDTQEQHRHIFVDVTAPEISHDAPSNVRNTDEIDVNITVSDNTQNFDVYLDDNHIHSNSSFDSYVPEDTEVVLTETLSLEDGSNIFTIRAVDAAGNETSEEIVVNRNAPLSRLYGDTRFHTAVEISRDGWDSADTVVLANSHEFADALAGVPLAHQLDAPILPAQSHILEPVILSELERLNPEEIILLGGEAAIDAGVEAQLNELGYETNRLAGETRYHTASLIADELTRDSGSNEAIVASGEEFADAMSVASYAAAEGLPIYLVEQHAIHPDLMETLQSYDSLTVIGGPVAISENVVSQLPEPTRLYGETRYDTNLAVFDHFGEPSEHLYVATGDNFVDALTGSVLAARNDSAVALTTSQSITS